MGEEDRAHEREQYIEHLKNTYTPEQIKEKCDYYEKVSLPRIQKGDRNFIDDEAYICWMYLREPEPWEIAMRNHYAKQMMDFFNQFNKKPDV